MNNETSFKNTTTKGSRCKRVRVRKCPFWCRRLVGSLCEASSRVFLSEGVPSGIRSCGCEREVYLGYWRGAL